MACKAIDMWTFPALVGAFLDLAIAYSMLCASAVAYVASKFLSLFGLSLPCRCSGLFGHLGNSYDCVQRALVDRPLERISSLHVSIKSKTPFNHVPFRDQNSEMESEIGKKSLHEVPQKEVSCDSCLEKKLEYSSPIREQDMHFGTYGFPVSKDRCRAESLKQRLGLRRRRRGSVQYRQFNSSCSQDSIAIDSQYLSFPPIANNSDDDSTKESCSEAKHDKCTYDAVIGHEKASNDQEKPGDITLQEKVLMSSGSTQSVDVKDTSEEVSAPEKFRNDGSLEASSSCISENEKDRVRALERALKEERLAHAKLCLELDKERSAAATAADEAMAMILRLQKEKASIEMEARQFQRMSEEKAAFDAEEMNIMMEILLRREKEKHFLEEEVEAYRQTMFADEQFDSDLQDTAATQGQGIEKDELVLQRISKSFDKEKLGSEDADSAVVHDILSINQRLRSNSPVPALDVQFGAPLFSPSKSGHYESMKPLGGVGGEKGDTFSVEGLGSNSKQPAAIPRVSQSCSNILTENSKGLDNKMSSSETFSGFKENAHARSKSASCSRRNSMSAFDYERMKIDSEVGWLRERLKFVQQGRERLNFSAASPEGGNGQVQLLDDIAAQIRKIRRLRNPQKAMRQASLPPLSSKDVPPKKHWRSPSLEERQSS